MKPIRKPASTFEKRVPTGKLEAILLKKPETA
jgi:hypothetical protein